MRGGDRARSRRHLSQQYQPHCRASAGKPVLLAHRGIAQRFDETDLKNDTCTASRMLPPRHGYLENTVPSMQAGFAAEADIVEIDVHPTTDGEFAVFHDWTLDCRTDGHGVTRKHSMAEMRRLDIGYGYTADGGKTFLFRGQGIGMMPTLAQVLSTSPDRRFLINIKSRDPSEGEKLAAVLNALPAAQRAGIIVYGGDEPIDVLGRLAPDIKTASRKSLKGCLFGYVGYGWTGLLPEACRHRMMLVPVRALAVGLAGPLSQPDAGCRNGGFGARPLSRRRFFHRHRRCRAAGAAAAGLCGRPMDE
ncbi:glycerophosphoryl diester phosphodiesterase protein [Rhizobium sp. NXC14]|nr:glycerophosphoryl diester phosphodiesterase protein [Rhizobium sp. NXC14]